TFKKMKKTKVGIIGTVGVPAKYGGFETLAHQLVLNLGQQLDLTVYSSSKSYSKAERVPTWKGAKIKYIPLKANGVQSIFYDILSMIHAMIFCDVLLVLGVSGCIFLPFVKMFSTKRIIVNVDGLEWRRAKWSGWIKKFLIFSERMAIQFADEIITDNAGLQDYVLDHYGIHSSLIEYGADHVSPVGIQGNLTAKYSFLEQEYAFKVCRIEPENNIHLVLAAFKELPQLPLVLVGNWSHSTYGIALKATYGKLPHLHLLDPIYEPTELNMLRSNCSVYVHGHSAGGTNPSLVEAMYLGLPIIAFDVIYNQVTTEFKGVYFKTKSDLLTQILSLSPVNLQELGLEMKRIADRRYTWAYISRKYQTSFIGQINQPTTPILVDFATVATANYIKTS
ncbi:MAG: DUF1972 domain-containing protein, partial [Saprospiraceae bacterium]